MSIGAIRGNIVYAYWGTYPNFGDQLTPLLLRHYGYTPVYSHYKPIFKHVRKADFVSVGTLLGNTPEDFSGVILGTGMDDYQKTFKYATIVGVRGYLTKKNMLISDNILVGDPGLLVSYMYPKELPKKWDLGVVPHFVDKKDDIIEIWKKRFGSRVKIIDVQRKPGAVIKDIKRCRNIISSSLHGLIVADAFGIPNIMFVIRRNIPKYGDHK
ncbi:MAG: polysaccharide pyruvyl transferase family protein, partial [Candidatus Omnitrophota bacterium]